MAAALLLRAAALSAAAAAAPPPPGCGGLKVGEAFPASHAMEGSMSGTFSGDAAACCAVCSANKQCAAITWAERTCFLHPVGMALGPPASIEGKTSAVVKPSRIPAPVPPPQPQPITPAPKGAKNVLFLISDGGWPLLFLLLLPRAIHTTRVRPLRFL